MPERTHKVVAPKNDIIKSRRNDGVGKRVP